MCARLPREGFENPAHAFLIARALYEVDDVAGASSLIGEAVRLNPTSPEAHYYHGLIQDESGNPGGALLSFLKSRELDLATPAPPWSVTSESLMSVVATVLEGLPETLRGVLDQQQVFLSDVPGVEVVVDGEVLVHDFVLTRADEHEVAATARAAAAELGRRAGL